MAGFSKDQLDDLKSAESSDAERRAQLIGHLNLLEDERLRLMKKVRELNREERQYLEAIGELSGKDKELARLAMEDKRSLWQRVVMGSIGSVMLLIAIAELILGQVRPGFSEVPVIIAALLSVLFFVLGALYFSSFFLIRKKAD